MNTLLSKKKVVLGLSGGVDSTSAALLLKDQGYEVIGLFFDICKDKGETALKAEKVAAELGIKFIYKNMHTEFYNKVVNNFVDEYLCGRTPNPCIVCNPWIKFKVLIEIANEEGAFYIASGHYANTQYNEEFKTYHIKVATNIKKDQSYMLYRLPSTTIERLILPLAKFEDKEIIRNIAKDNAMSNANQKDSQEICFIENGKNYMDFLNENGHKSKKGNFIDKAGNVLGKHEGISKYTIGQRKGLGITFGKPVFVTKINPTDNTVTLGDSEDLFENKVPLTGCYFQASDSDQVPKELLGRNLTAKIRYAAKPAKGEIVINQGVIYFDFREKQRASTPGQSVVIYLEDQVVGGGFIKN